MNVVTEIDVYEVDGTAPAEPVTLRVHSHWVDRDRAVIETPNGARYTIVRGDLSRAIDNAGNRR